MAVEGERQRVLLKLTDILFLLRNDAVCSISEPVRHRSMTQSLLDYKLPRIWPKCETKHFHPSDSFVIIHRHISTYDRLL